ncbi:hypothetical protein KDL44_03470 [bacterium]|nr:hypothetical protein [bacterium]
MTIRRRMREQQSLGAAIDARQRSARELEQQDGLGGSGAAPLTSGGSTAGGGGVTLDPALPESFVTGLAGGAGNPYQAGELTITGSGSASVTQDALAGEIDVHAPAYTAGDGLDLTAEEFAVDSTVLRTSGDQAVSGLKTFATLPRSAATPLDDTDLTTKDYVDERTKVVHRQVFPAAGSRDSLSGNSEINLPWAVSAYPSGAGIATVTLNSDADVSFNSVPVAIFNTSYLELSWTSSQVSGSIVMGAQVALGAQIHRYGAIANLSAEIRVEDVNKISSVYLTINDSNGSFSPTSPVNLLSSLSSSTWQIVVSNGISIQSLSESLYAVLTINGTDDSMNVGGTNVQVRTIQVVQLE